MSASRLNPFQKLVNLATGGRYKAYASNPILESRRQIRESALKLKKIGQRLKKDESSAGGELYEHLLEYEEERIVKGLRAISVDSLKKVSGVAQGRVDTLKEYGYTSIQDFRTNLNSIRNIRGFGGDTGISIIHHVRDVVKDMRASPPSWDRDSPSFQKLICLALELDRIGGQRTLVNQGYSEIKAKSKQFSPVSFLGSGIRKKALTDTRVLDVSSDVHSQMQSIETRLEPQDFSSESLSRSEYIRGIGLLDRAHDDSISESKTNVSDLHPIYRLDADLVDAIEKLSLKVDQLKGCILRRYQDFGAKFILIRKHVFIGDEMGLGKTIQVLGAISHLWPASGTLRVLIVVPASLSENWRHEFLDKTHITPVILMGTDRRRGLMDWLKRGGVAITSYSTLNNDLSYYSNLDRLDMVIADEAQYIKNPSAQRSQALKSILPKAEYAVVMTGTPVENHPGEFIHILNGLSHDVPELRKYGNGGSWPSANQFRQMTRTVFLRRNKEDVLTELPELINTVEWIQPTSVELQHHLEDMQEAMGIMRIRHRITTRRDNASSKIKRALELAGEYRESGKHVVIFSYFRVVLDLMEAALPNVIGYIHGGVSPKERMSIIEGLGKADAGRVILAQIVAGGVGLNMQEASAVIILEPQFNPATEYQAVARVHRMGQRSSVNVHRLIAENTIEEDITKMLQKKIQYMTDYGKESLLKDSSSDAISGNDVQALRSARVTALEELLAS
jgi:SNF2 family DNA or RNA helicase